MLEKHADRIDGFLPNYADVNSENITDVMCWYEGFFMSYINGVIMIQLDISHRKMHNKPIETELESWFRKA